MEFQPSDGTQELLQQFRKSMDAERISMKEAMTGLIIQLAKEQREVKPHQAAAMDMVVLMVHGFFASDLVSRARTITNGQILLAKQTKAKNGGSLPELTEFQQEILFEASVKVLQVMGMAD